MKYMDLFYIIISSSLFLRWLSMAKDTLSIFIALCMSLLGLGFLYYKTRLMRANALLKEEELKEKN